MTDRAGRPPVTGPADRPGQLPPHLAGLRHQVRDEPDPDWLARPAV
ncbi:hypothetical protein [Streptomyces chrestomyceticus]